MTLWRIHAEMELQDPINHLVTGEVYKLGQATPSGRCFPLALERLDDSCRNMFLSATRPKYRAAASQPLLQPTKLLRNVDVEDTSHVRVQVLTFKTDEFLRSS